MNYLAGNSRSTGLVRAWKTHRLGALWLCRYLITSTRSARQYPRGVATLSFILRTTVVSRTNASCAWLNSSWPLDLDTPKVPSHPNETNSPPQTGKTVSGPGVIFTMQPAYLSPSVTSWVIVKIPVYAPAFATETVNKVYAVRASTIFKFFIYFNRFGSFIVKITLIVVTGLILIIMMFSFDNTTPLTESLSIGLTPSPADTGPLLPLSAATATATASVQQHHAKITSSIQNTGDHDPAVISPITDSQLANVRGYSESSGQANISSRPSISAQDPLTNADWLGLDNSDPHPNWEPSSDQYLIESTERGIDNLDKYENGNTYEDWQPTDRVETGFADQEGYE